MWKLETEPATQRPELMADPVAAAVTDWAGATPRDRLLVAEIDPDLADTAACCEAYDVPAEASANCVVVVAKRGSTVRMAACVVLATSRTDVNGVVRKHLGARRASFAPQDQAVAQSGMEFGGITPIGLPADWPILVDPAVLDQPWCVIGSGLRRSKLVVPGAALGELAAAEVVGGVAAAD